MANNYTTSTDALADVQEAQYSSSDWTIMGNFVSAASRLIDLEVGRGEGFFFPTTDDKTLYYDGSGEKEQEIDEFSSITSVSVAEEGGASSTDYTAWSSSDYFVAPYNYSSMGKPINKLIIDFNGSKSIWYRYRKSVQVVGIPGYASTTPAIVEQACKIQSVRWFMRAKQGWQDIGGNESVGEKHYKGNTELDPDVKMMLWPFKLELQK